MDMKNGTIWIGDLEPYMDENFLKQAFMLMGENLLHAKVIKNKFTGLLTGYGFLEFGDEAVAQRVLHRCNGKIVPNTSPPKRFKLNHASYGKEHLQQKEHSLFVGDLSPEVDDLALYNAFSSKYPSVKAAKVVLDQGGISKGYGFVRFMLESEYQAALVEMQNAAIVGSKPIRVSIATPRRSFGSNLGQDYRNYYQYSGYDYQGYYNWQNYQQHYYGYEYDQNSSIYDSSYSQQYETGYENSENVIEEHDIPLDTDYLNDRLMKRNEEFYAALDASRWLPIESLDPPLLPIK
ncbi:tRNA Selenocysteine associated protein [Tachypleus tridentatus]|uniref:tRNA Selenocysteine associated protein n=1 Tax=Tachypleus tridentatus TaxID=6853 RepID=UPI003FD1C288